MVTENWWKKIIFCFLLNFITCFSTSCDVFELKFFINRHFQGTELLKFSNTEEFVSFIMENPRELPKMAENPFIDDAANATQMLGYAVFFPEGNTDPQQVYVAKKRAYVDGNTPVINYRNSDTPDKFARTTVYDHTERQLIASIINGCHLNQQTNGTICVYTYAAPCRDEGADNSEMCCVDYYKKLATKFHAINFNVYFIDNKQIITRNYKGDYNFYLALSSMVQDIKLQLNMVRGTVNQIQLSDIENLNFGKSIWHFTSKRAFEQINAQLSGQHNSEGMFNQLYNFERLSNLRFYILQ